MVPRPEPSGGSMVWAEQQVHGPACAASGRQAASRGRGAAVTQPFRRSQSRFLRLFSFFSSSFPLHSHFSYSLYNFSKIYHSFLTIIPPDLFFQTEEWIKPFLIFLSAMRTQGPCRS